MTKLENLTNILKNTGHVIVALSGGVDSTFLTTYATKVLGSENVIAVTFVAPNFATDEIEYAKELCTVLGIQHILIKVKLPEEFYTNGKERCYYCKKSLFSNLIEVSNRLSSNYDSSTSPQILTSNYTSALSNKNGSDVSCSHFPSFICNKRFFVLDGTNLDDLSDYRPGIRAAKELGVLSPLAEAELTKNEIRNLSKELNISIWNKPAYACLASRIPCGTTITEEKMLSIYKIEKFLRNMGFAQVRVRVDDETARIELAKDKITELGSNAMLIKQTADLAKSAGFKFISLDLCGYKMGNMN